MDWQSYSVPIELDADLQQVGDHFFGGGCQLEAIQISKKRNKMLLLKRI